MSRWLVTTTLNSYRWASEMFSMLAETVHLGSKKGFWVEWHHHRCHVQKKKRIFLCDLKKLVLGLEQLHCLLCVVDGEEPRNVGVVALSCVFGVDVTLYFFYQKREQDLFYLCTYLWAYYVLYFDEEKTTPL